MGRDAVNAAHGLEHKWLECPLWDHVRSEHAESVELLRLLSSPSAIRAAFPGALAPGALMRCLLFGQAFIPVCPHVGFLLMGRHMSPKRGVSAGQGVLLSVTMLMMRWCFFKRPVGFWQAKCTSG